MPAAAGLLQPALALAPPTPDAALQPMMPGSLSASSSPMPTGTAGAGEHGEEAGAVAGVQAAAGRAGMHPGAPAEPDANTPQGALLRVLNVR
eukprot:14415597-Alexandrium_andersonii.AAC.1